MRMAHDGCEFDFRGTHVRCPLPGAHQVNNAATAVAVLQKLGIAPGGIDKARWPGRLEVVSTEPEIILDGAHNTAGAHALADYIRSFYADRTVWMIFGAMRDKRVEEITEILFPLAARVIVTTPAYGPRALPPEELAALSVGSPVEPAANIADAIALTRSAPPGTAIFITGSLYLVGEARALLVK